MNRQADKAALLDLIKQSNTIVLASHAHPDGDAIGSLLALGLGLSSIGKDIRFYNRDAVPYNFTFLPGSEKVSQDLFETQPDLTILLDCAEPHRIGESFPKIGWGKKVAVLDHHKTFDPEFADVYFRDVSAAATGELVYEVLLALDAEISIDVAKCIYCTLVTDTGSFRYSNTKKRTFEIAGDLVEMGVDPWEITAHVYESQPLERIQLLSKVLQTLEISPCGRIAFLIVEATDLAGEDESLIDGFINYARSISGVEVATQLLGRDAEWRISFRSKGKVDVSEIAQIFGGGGHRNAAGCTIVGDRDAVKERLSSAFLSVLNEKE